MSKQLRQRIARVIPAFNSCRSDDNNNNASGMFCFSPMNEKTFDDEFPLPPPPRPSPTCQDHRRTSLTSVSCGGCRPTTPRRRRSRIGNNNNSSAYDADADDLPGRRETPPYLWRQNQRWHVLAANDSNDNSINFTSERIKIDSDDSDAMFFHSAAYRQHANLRRHRKHSNSHRSTIASSSSADSGWFSSEEEEQQQLEEDYCDHEEEQSFLSTGSCRSTSAAKVADSFAVVKRSEDPKEDFRQSMVEMVVEKGMYDAAELEQLLQCFLSLNSKHHHAAIIDAFSDVCNTLFPEKLRQLYKY